MGTSAIMGRRNQRLSKLKLYLRSMLKRWGSANKDSRQYLNPELVQAISIFMDYFIVHEVCDLKFAQHCRALYRLLDRMLPGSRGKRRLESTEL